MKMLLAVVFLLVTNAIHAGGAESMASAPNIKPGLWQYESAVRIMKPFPLHPVRDMRRECFSEEDVRSPGMFLDHEGACETTYERASSGHLIALLTCPTDAGDIIVSTEMYFRWDTAEGTARMESKQNGVSSVIQVDMRGRWIEDC